MIPTGHLSAVDLLDHLQVLQRQRATLDPEGLHALARYHELRSSNSDFDNRSIPAEIALALHASPSHADSQIALAQSLTHRLPDTLEAMHNDQIDLAKARALVDITHSLTTEDTRVVEAKIPPTAAEHTLTQIRSTTRYQRDRVDPAAAQRRHHQTKTDRNVSFQPIDNGPAQLYLPGPDERAFLARTLLDNLARRTRTTGDNRPLTALRHDLMLDFILGKGNAHATVTAYLHVPATTLAGTNDNPGILSGYGPITRQACQKLATDDTTSRRVYTDPINSVVNDMDRHTYRPCATLAEFIAVRDGTCIAPGCPRSAHKCQTHHTVR